MSYLFDTNCFVRLTEEQSPHRIIVLAAIRKLRSEGQRLCCTPQVLAEFWNVSTRPASARGGLGLTTEQTERKVSIIEKYFELLPDDLSTFLHWRKLVFDLDISGVQVHDAKLVASLIAHRIEHLVTLNIKDFQRFPNISVIDPHDI